MTEQALIRGIVLRDRNAFRHLVNQYQRKIIKITYHFVGNMEDAEDLSQEIFLEIIRSMPDFKQKSTLDTWIYRITVNRALNLAKKNKRKSFIFSWSGMTDSTRDQIERKTAVNTTEEEQLEQENRKMLYKAISHLPENQRIAFVLHKLDEIPYQDISEIMQVSLSAVESLIHRAKNNLQKELKSQLMFTNQTP
jgi:RNA polymerase sigma-70 factor (ECF subfamily)